MRQYQLERAPGFTLIELLVVLVLIGIITSFAVMSIGNQAADQLKHEARRLRAVVRLAADEAVLNGREIGMVFTHDGYHFSKLKPAGDHYIWVRIPKEEDRTLRPYKLPDTVELDIVVNGGTEPVDLKTSSDDSGSSGEAENSGDANPGLSQEGDKKKKKEKVEEDHPQVVLLSSGEVTPFQLVLSNPDIRQRYVLKCEFDGSLDLSNEQ